MTDNSAGKSSKKAAITDRDAQLILIKIGGTFCAIDIMKIVEIVKYIPVTKVPRSPEFIEGVIELRGAIIPVIDMRKRFDFKVERSNEKIRIVIIGVMDKTAGLIVDEVKEVLKVPVDKISTPSKIVQGIESEYLSGIVSNRGRIILVLDLDKILTTTEKMQFKKLIFKDKKKKTGGNE